jgi:dipeptidyl aminopeptidase/acylaminoacyl peptidase
MRHTLRTARAWVLPARRGLAALLLAATIAMPALAAERPPFEARAGLDIANAAAQAWSPDAYLVYVENDEDLNGQGAAVRWGYLFYSPSLETSRGYSVRDGRLAVAEYLTMKFDAPPLGAGWIDSGAALAIAEKKAGLEFRTEHGATLSTMLLMRGAFHGDDPDETTWTLIYSSPDAPSLFVVIDAAQGKVRRMWRG